MVCIDDSYYKLKFSNLVLENINILARVKPDEFMRTGTLSYTDLRIFVGCAIHTDTGVKLSIERGLSIAEDWLDCVKMQKGIPYTYDRLIYDMGVTVPFKLLALEYIGVTSSKKSKDGGDVDEEKEENFSIGYEEDLSFSFFFNQYLCDRSIYDGLTPREVAFIFKSWETKFVRDGTNTRDAFLNAYTNANRGVKSFKQLYPKLVKEKDSSAKRLESLLLKQDLSKSGSWLDTAYKSIGVRKP